MSLALYRKYRPARFEDVAGQETVVRTVRNQLASGSLAHAYLFTGPRGVGKTTIARILAKAANCLELKDGEPCDTCTACVSIQNGSALDIIEIDAASNTQVEKVRDVIVDGVRFAPSALKRKVYIIDEVHMLSTGSFNALLKTLEEPPAHALFILATTEIHKVPATVISRCQRFDFRKIPAQVIVDTLKSIAKKEGIEVEDQVFSEVARHADGGLRDAESVFGQLLALGERKVTMREAMLVLPASSAERTFEILAALARKDAAGAIQALNVSVEEGIDMPHLCDDLIDTLRAALLVSIGSPASARDPSASSGLGQFDDTARAAIAQAAAQLGTARAADAVRRLSDAKRHMKSDSIPQLSLEIAFVELCSREDAKGLEGLGSSGSLGGSKKPELSTASVIQPVETVPSQPSEPPKPPQPTSVVPIAPIATAFGGAVPVISLDDVKSRWPEVFATLKSVNASLPIVINAGEISRIDGDRIEMNFTYAMHADMVNADRNRKLLEPVLERIYGKKMYVIGTHAHKESDETVNLLVQEFGGSAA